MEHIEQIVDVLNYYVWSFGVPAGGETIPWLVLLLLGTGVFLTIRLRFIQFRRLAHGFAVTSGRYDDPDHPGDVSHFQALATALSATVGIGNIAGVAIAIHWGGPGALFWMWMTAVFGMAVKFSEVTLAQAYRDVRHDADAHKWEGSVSGGPMYYIERGLGRRWKPLAVAFAVILGTTALLNGNAVQANTVADTMHTALGIPPWTMGLVTASIVALVILGGIRRIGKVTGILSPVMASIYLVGALIIVVMNAGEILPTLALIIREAFNPSAGIAGTGAGVFAMTLMWGVRQGAFSNEAGQGSAPIAHAAAKTNEPVSEGVVGLVEPFIDTIVIITITAFVIILTGSWDDGVPTEVALAGGDLSYVVPDEDGRYVRAAAPAEIRVEDGAVRPSTIEEPFLAWHEVRVERLFEDEAQSRPFTGVINPAEGTARSADGTVHVRLFGDAVESGAPLTMLAFRRGLAPLGDWGHYVVIVSVLLFAVSTAIAWCYYGDRSVHYLIGPQAVLPYRIVYVVMHFFGAVLPLVVVWNLGSVFLGAVMVPNLIALIMLNRKVCELSDSYFARRPWME